MLRRWFPLVLAGVVGLGVWLTATAPARAQGVDPNRFYHYPYYFFPFDYWPTMSAPWPEPPGAPYRPYPAYMAYPPYREPHWRYEWWEPQHHYRGQHFWLDVF